MTPYYLYFVCVLVPLIMYWLLPERWALYPLLVATALFLLKTSPISLLILTITSLSTFYITQKISHKNHLVLLIIVQSLVLFIFFKSNWISFSENRIIPLGFSYYTFRQVHYSLDAYKNKLPKHSLADFLGYMFYLPTFIIGPINRFQPFLLDLKRKRWNNDLFSKGLERLLYGGVKITFLGNFLFSNFTQKVVGSLENDWLASYLSMVGFFFNSYFQFSGYSDLAIGISYLFGIKVIENFNYPFLAKNISDFWNRWHISLSEWCRDYVFLPLLGLSRNALISVVCSMLVLAFWHEFSLRYVLWGLIHAIAIFIFNHYQKSSFAGIMARTKKVNLLIGNIITLHFVMLSFVLIKEDSLSESIKEIGKILCISF